VNGHFGVDVVNVFHFRADILDHVERLSAPGTGAADEHDRLVCRQGRDFGFQLVDGNVFCVFDGAGGKLVRVANVDQVERIRIVGNGFLEIFDVDAALFGTGFNRGGSGRFGNGGSADVLDPGRIAVGEDLDIGIAEFYRLPGGFVTQLSCGPLAVEDDQLVFFRRQLVLLLVKAHIGNIDGPGDVTLVELFAFRA
jgi:hypothetical protein